MRLPCWPGIVTSRPPPSRQPRPPVRSSFRWTDELHQRKGNLLFADGHVEKRNNATLEFAAVNEQPANPQFAHPGVANPTPGQSARQHSGNRWSTRPQEQFLGQVWTPLGIFNIRPPR